MKKIIRVGTRGSLLATTQTGYVVEALKAANPEVEFETVIVKTEGDLKQKISLKEFGTQGVFIKELEEALESNKVDLAVHSLKDVPHDIPDNMELVSFFTREDPADVLISKHSHWKDLPEGAKIGTGSPRRIVQLKELRPDFQFADLRGNIDSRMQKVEEGEYDAIILAQAGLNRLNQGERASYSFPKSELTPAIAQGIVAIEARKGDLETREIARTVNVADSELAAQIERTFMAAMGGGCKVPLAAFAEMQETEVEFMAVLGDLDNQNLLRQTQSISKANWKTELQAFVESFSAACKQVQLTLPSEVKNHQLLEDREEFFEGK